jgi:hypothetical protein
MQVALEIKRNAEEKQKIHKELLTWETQVENTQKTIKIKNQVPPRPKQPKEKIKSLDFRKWDEFNVVRFYFDVRNRLCMILITKLMKKSLKNHLILRKDWFRKKKEIYILKRKSFKKRSNVIQRVLKQIRPQLSH